MTIKNTKKVLATILLSVSIFTTGCNEVSSVSTVDLATESDVNTKGNILTKENGTNKTSIEEKGTGSSLETTVSTETKVNEDVTTTQIVATEVINPEGQAIVSPQAEVTYVAPYVEVVEPQPVVESQPAVETPAVVPDAPIYTMGDMTNYLTQVYGSEANFQNQYLAALNQIRTEQGVGTTNYSFIMADRSAKVAEICAREQKAYHPTYPIVADMKGYGVALESSYFGPVKELTEYSIYDLVKKMTLGHTVQLATKGDIIYSGVSIHYFTLANSLYFAVVLDGEDKVGMSFLTQMGEQDGSVFYQGQMIYASYTSKYAGMTP